MKLSQNLLTGSALILAGWILGCATPVGVMPAGEKAIYRQLTQNALASERPSSFSNQLLARLSLAERFKLEPQAVLLVVTQ